MWDPICCQIMSLSLKTCVYIYIYIWRRAISSRMPCRKKKKKVTAQVLAQVVHRSQFCSNCKCLEHVQPCPCPTPDLNLISKFDFWVLGNKVKIEVEKLIFWEVQTLICRFFLNQFANVWKLKIDFFNLNGLEQGPGVVPGEI